MTNPLMDALTNLEDTLRRHRIPVVDHQQPGLPAGQIDATLRSIDVHPHPDLITLWTWHNGVRPNPRISGWSPELSIMSCYWPLDLANALSLRDMQIEGDDPPVTPPLYTFPVIGWDNAAELYLDTVNGAVNLHDPNDPPDDLASPFLHTWPSLIDWIDDVITLYNTGHVYIDPLSETPTLDRKHWPADLPFKSHW